MVKAEVNTRAAKRLGLLTRGLVRTVNEVGYIAGKDGRVEIPLTLK